ncbi:MAG: hypothetical protein ABW054_03295 [Casimicrobiaceae bacterium]|jgi:hypothetical protein
MKHIITIAALAFSASAVGQETTNEACKKSVEAARAMFRSGVSDGKVPPTVASYVNGMREEDGPQKLREYVVAVFARGYCMGSIDTMRGSQSKNSKP